MKRLYQSIIEEHFSDFNQMAFMTGPRQVGKTTIAKKVCGSHENNLYLNWDFIRDREFILSGQDKIINKIKKPTLGKKNLPIVVLDEIHKFKDWKNYLKGYFDYSKNQAHTLVTGSAKLDIYKKGGDSLMGRYLLYHAHPLSVGELLNRLYDPKEIYPPKKISEEKWRALYEYGGFPDPLLKQNKRFLTRWQQLRFQQLFQEDIRSLSDISDLAQMEILAKLLHNQASMQLNYHALAKMVQVSDKTIKRWINILELFYFSFTIQPWSKNITRSLIKEPKLYLWDWSIIKNKGARIENLIASHLLKAIHYWTDIGLGNYELYYLRDKEKREVDFLIAKNDRPWIIIEVKSSNNQSISSNLHYYHQQTNAKHAFQVAFNMPYINEDCFTHNKPIIVPAKTLLSQLV